MSPCTFASFRKKNLKPFCWLLLLLCVKRSILPPPTTTRKKKNRMEATAGQYLKFFFSLFFLRKAFAVLIAYAVVYILQKHAISLILFVDRIVTLEKVSLHLPWIFKSNRRIPRKFSGEKRKTNLFSTRTNAQKEMNVFEWIIKFTYELVWNR